MPICLFSGIWRLVETETLLSDLSFISALHGIPGAFPLQKEKKKKKKKKKQMSKSSSWSTGNKKISNVETCKQIYIYIKKGNLAGVANYKCAEMMHATTDSVKKDAQSAAQGVQMWRKKKGNVKKKKKLGDFLFRRERKKASTRRN